jgi:hypothetical protein
MEGVQSVQSADATRRVHRGLTCLFGACFAGDADAETVGCRVVGRPIVRSNGVCGACANFIELCGTRSIVASRLEALGKGGVLPTWTP